MHASTSFEATDKHRIFRLKSQVLSRILAIQVIREFSTIISLYGDGQPAALGSLCPVLVSLELVVHRHLLNLVETDVLGSHGHAEEGYTNDPQHGCFRGVEIRDVISPAC